MSSSRGFSDRAEQVSWGDAEAGSVNKEGWGLCSQPSSWMEKSAEGLSVCSDFSAQKSSGWHWATQAVFPLLTSQADCRNEVSLCCFSLQLIFVPCWQIKPDPSPEVVTAHLNHSKTMSEMFESLFALFVFPEKNENDSRKNRHGQARTRRDVIVSSC